MYLAKTGKAESQTQAFLASNLVHLRVSAPNLVGIH